MYKLKDIYTVKGDLITFVPEGRVRVPVNIGGRDLKRIIPASQREPRREIIVRAATQSDLEFLFKEGNRFIEQVDKGKDTAQEDKEPTYDPVKKTK